MSDGPHPAHIRAGSTSQRTGNSRHRAVITGLGLITPIGIGHVDFWNGVRAGRRGVREVTRFDASQFRTRIAGEVDRFDPADYVESRRPSRLDRFAQFSLAATRLALDDAHLAIGNGSHANGHPSGNGDDGSHGSSGGGFAVPGERVGVAVGSALGGVSGAEDDHAAFLRDGIRAVSPSLALRVFVGAGACNIAIHFGARGPTIGNSNSCASGAIAIGEGLQLIREGKVDVVIAGGVETPLAPLTFGAFTLIHAMSTQNDLPAEASRPFDAARDGFVMAEAAAILILERLDHAIARDAKIYAEISGFATTNDAYHMTAPHPEGKEAARAMRLALEDAGLTPEEIEHVNAHGSSTLLNDRIETVAIKSVFGERARRVPVSGTKGMHAHALGATGALEAAIAALSIAEGYVPSTANLTNPDPECDLDYVPGCGRETTVRTVLSNSFGFGGANACIVLQTVE
ncbi:MAG TPA: beta-ketoacyl synthase N-terminal-like domain-containing protein [Candidatus Eisenbacteria bacterium]|nr:beta-ketoacyl synthase N-terminal-like domain-containing protein [Candidatus Eisenbacteria bacterium]